MTEMPVAKTNESYFGAFVYRIPPKCGYGFIGQIGRCINQRMTEQSRIVQIESYQSQSAYQLADSNFCHSVLEQRIF